MRRVKCPKSIYDWEPRGNKPKSCPSCKARLDIKKSELLEKAASLDYVGDVRSDSSISQISGDLALASSIDQPDICEAGGIMRFKSSCCRLEMKLLQHKDEYRRDDRS